MDIPKEIERKFIIRMPDISTLAAMADHTVSDITQIYLESVPNITHRVRCRRFLDTTVYTETKKIRLDKITSYEDEHEISADEFDIASKSIRQGTRALKKQRHTFSFGTHTVEIDLYPEWQNTAIMEIELTSSDDEIELPDFIKIVREVSGVREYSNASFAVSLPDEDI